MKPSFFVGLVLTAVLCAAHARGADIHGGGGSAVYPVFSVWTQDYQRRTGIAINYQAIGSGGGIRQSLSRTIDFGNTDKPPDPNTLRRAKLFQCPVLIIAIVPVLNLPGIKSNELALDGPTLAGIFLGRVTRWDDAAIARQNPGVALPSRPIVVVHRSDASGTTFNFTAYLSAVSPQWRAQIGSETAVDWPLGAAAKGNAGVVATLQRTAGAIAYVEYAYAQQHGLTVPTLINRDGARVVADAASFQAAAEHAEVVVGDDVRLNLTNAQGPASWPLMAASYMLLRTDAPKPTNGVILKFLHYAFTEGRPAAERLRYVALPEGAVRQVERSWQSQLHAWP